MNIVERTPRTSFVQIVVIRVVLCLTLAVTILGTRELVAQCQKLGEHSKAHDEVKKILEDQNAAWNKGDLDGFMLGYWNNDALTFYVDNTIEKGYEPLKQRYFKKYKAEGKEMGKLAFSDVEVLPKSDTFAVVRGKWKLEKSKETAEGLYTLWFEKKPEGWRIIHDHSSAAPKTP